MLNWKSWTIPQMKSLHEYIPFIEIPLILVGWECRGVGYMLLCNLPYMSTGHQIQYIYTYMSTGRQIQYIYTYIYTYMTTGRQIHYIYTYMSTGHQIQYIYTYMIKIPSINTFIFNFKRLFLWFINIHTGIFEKISFEFLL